MSDATYTQADLDAAVAKALADAKNVGPSVAGVVSGVAAVKDAVAAGKIFYHLYVCRFASCVAAANPQPGSQHQRGVNLATATPRTDVKCPGCGQPMVIGRNGLDAKGNALPAHITEDSEGNAVFHGQAIVQEAPGQPDQTAEIEKENA